jgi:hypothetical protein
MEERVTKLAEVSAKFSKSWRDARFRRTGAPDHRSFNLPRVVAAIGPDQFDPGKALAYLVEDQPDRVAAWIAAE